MRKHVENFWKVVVIHMVVNTVRRGRKYQKNRRCNVKRDNPDHGIRKNGRHRGDFHKGKSKKYKEK